jgi:hypothetical protein
VDIRAGVDGCGKSHTPGIRIPGRPFLNKSHKYYVILVHRSSSFLFFTTLFCESCFLGTGAMCSCRKEQKLWRKLRVYCSVSKRSYLARLFLDGPGVESRCEHNFLQHSRPAYTFSSTIGTELFLRVKRPRSGINHPHYLKLRLKKE